MSRYRKSVLPNVSTFGRDTERLGKVFGKAFEI
jgi:hypothetical protein